MAPPACVLPVDSLGLSREGGQARVEGGCDFHHITSMSAWMAPAALMACRMAIMSRGPMPSEFKTVHQLLQRHAVANERELVAVLLHADLGARRRHGAAARERCRLRDLRAFRDRDRQVALGDGDHGDAHVPPHDDDARALVDDDLGRLVRLDLQLLDLGEERDHVAQVLLRHRDLHGRGVERLGGRHADEVVDGGGDAFGGGEVGIAQSEPHLVHAVQCEVDLALDDGAVGDAADGRDAAGDLGGLALGLEAPDGERALGDRVDIAVGGQKRRDEQDAALQALGVAERRHGDVDAGSLRAEGGQVGGHHHGGDIAGAQRLAADVQAQPFQHRLQGLLGEGRIVDGVAGAVEADHEAVADQLVLAHAFHIGEVLDARGGGERTCAGQQRQRDGGRGGQSPHPPALPILRPRHPDLLPDGSDPGII